MPSCKLFCDAVKTKGRSLNNPNDTTIILKLMAGVKVNEDLTMLHDQLFALLMKYQHYLTRHPVQCKDFKYWFNIATKIPNSGNS